MFSPVLRCVKLKVVNAVSMTQVVYSLKKQCLNSSNFIIFVLH